MKDYRQEGTKEYSGEWDDVFCSAICRYCEETTYDIPRDRISLCAHCGAELLPCEGCSKNGGTACDYDNRRFGCQKFIHDDISDDDVAANPLTYQEFINLVYEEFSVYNTWFSELFRNVLDESAHFEDDGDRFNYLDRMLPDECPRQWIRRLKI